MTLNINGEQQTLVRESLTVAELLVVNKVESPDVVTVQINGKFLQRSLFGSARIHEGDAVDFLYYLGGGRC
jgi:sulfur carrier protein